jgi:tetratricopeptide (TPR) repeat protein
MAAGCATVSRTPIVVPPEAVREWAYGTDGSTREGRYVVRMTDGHREWEVEFPDAAYGSEVRVPLRAGGYQMKYSGGDSGLTGADREIEESDREQREKNREKIDPMYSLVDESPKKQAPKREKKESYLVGVAQIRQLYDSRNYEIALVQLVELEKDYPNDEKLLAMKGSIYRKLGKSKLARAAWEKVLALNPDNSVVAGALREMSEEDERAKPKGEEE